MRRILTGLLMAVAVFLSGCTEQPTEVNPGSDPMAPAGGQGAAVVCTAAGIQAQIDALAQDKTLRNSLQSKFKSIPTKFTKQNGTAARDKMLALVDAILDAYYADQFGSSTSVQSQVLDLISSLYCYIGLALPDLPEESLGEDGVVGVVTPGSPTTTLAVPSGHAAVTIPEGAAPEPTMIVVRKLPDEPGPLLTSLDQYPFFYEFSSFPEVTFNLDVLAGICPRDNLDAIDENLRLAHNVGPDFGDVEVLPRPEGAVPGLDCADLGEGEFPAFRRSSSRGGGRGAGWGSFSRALEPFVDALLPAPLHAANVLLLTTTGVGGTTKKFSPFGIVDQGSNPASLGIVDEAGDPASGTVSGPGTVYVKTSSQNGAPIQDVPVDFDGTEVLTNADGIAAFLWADAEPGATLTPSVPNEAPEGEGEGCPSDIPAPGPTGGYRPFVCFTPDEVTFSVAVDGEVVLFHDYDMFRNDFVDEESVKLYQNLVDFTGTGTRASGTSVLIHQGHASQCLELGCTTTWVTFATSMSEAGEGYTVTFGDDETAPLTAIGEDVKLLILALPVEDYTIAEINALKSFVGEGGRLVFVAEHDEYFPAIIDVENDLLGNMGAEAVNIGGMVDCGTVFLPQSSLQAHQITAGLTHLRIGCASVLSPGPDDQVLFYDTSGEEVLAAVAKVSLTPIEVGEPVALRRPLRSIARPTTPTPGLRPSSTTGR